MIKKVYSGNVNKMGGGRILQLCQEQKPCGTLLELKKKVGIILVMGE